MITFPSADDYVRAVQDPARSFVEEPLRSAVFPTHPLLGVPMPASGSSAVVFKAVIDGEEQALRFFTRHEVSTRERYQALNRHFTIHGIAANMATSVWLDDAITVNGQAWPAVRMQWVNGRTLDAYIGDLVDEGDTQTLSSLVTAWRRMVGVLQRSGFAHGDLQHGNVLVDDQGSLRLVDFDCAWLHGFDLRSAPSESGHRNYQRADAPWGEWMDTFPSLVIHTSLLALAKRPALWESMHNGENLIFESKDFAAPDSSPVWRELEQLQDQQVAAAAARLKQCCEKSWHASAGMESLLERRWWEQVGHDATKTVSAPKPTLAEQKTVIKPAASANRATAVPKLPPVTKMGNAENWPLKPTTATNQSGPATSWWAGAGPRPASVPGRPAPNIQTPRWNPSRVGRAREALTPFGLLVMSAVVIVVIVFVGRGFMDLISGTSDGLPDVVPSANSSTAWTKFQVSSSSELGSCTYADLKSSRITSYDTDVIDCNGNSSPYYFRLVGYGQISPHTWILDAQASRTSLKYDSSASCYSIYTATEGGFNYVYFVYKNTPYVAIVYASTSSQSLSELTAHSFSFVEQGC